MDSSIYFYWLSSKLVWSLKYIFSAYVIHLMATSIYFYSLFKNFTASLDIFHESSICFWGLFNIFYGLFCYFCILCSIYNTAKLLRNAVNVAKIKNPMIWAEKKGLKKIFVGSAIFFLHFLAFLSYFYMSVFSNVSVDQVQDYKIDPKACRGSHEKKRRESKEFQILYSCEAAKHFMPLWMLSIDKNAMWSVLAPYAPLILPSLPTSGYAARPAALDSKLLNMSK